MCSFSKLHLFQTLAYISVTLYFREVDRGGPSSKKSKKIHEKKPRLENFFWPPNLKILPTSLYICILK